MKRKINKKGQVPIILLFLVALVLIVVVLLSYFGFDKNFGLQSKDFSYVMGEVGFAEEFVFTLSENAAKEAIESGQGTKTKFQEIVRLREEGFRYESAGNFYGRIRNGDFEFVKNGNEHILTVKGLFVNSEREGNSVFRNFDLEMRFDDNGEIVKK